MFCSNKNDKERQNSMEIDRYLMSDAKENNKIIKLLLLGTGESGKTTIIKQMKILHLNGFTKTEKCDKIPQIKQNIHESIYDIVYNMDKLEPPIDLKNDLSAKSAKFILNIGLNEPSEYTDEYFDHVQILWADPGVKETFSRSNEFQLIDSAGYFLDRLDSIRQIDYEPSIQDMLFCRVKTTAISKIEFSVPVPVKYGGGNAKFWMYDVGGQRGERRKWFPVFEGIQAVLFLMAASDFDQTLREDNKKNRLQEAVDIFEDICKSRYLRDAGLIVFLNKQDLLQKKIEQGQRIEKYFPEYHNFILQEKNGKFHDEYERAKFFMKQKVDEIATRPVEITKTSIVNDIRITEKLPPRKMYYTHFTIATDTKNIKHIFDSVHDMILQVNITDTFNL